MSKHHNLIFENVELSLDNIPFYMENKYVRREAPKDFPYHQEIHHVNQAMPSPQDYVQSHTHLVAEMNIIIGESLIYNILLGDKTHEVSSPATIYIPPKLAHLSNVIRRNGLFVCVILADTCRTYDLKG